MSKHAIRAAMWDVVAQANKVIADNPVLCRAMDSETSDQFNEGLLGSPRCWTGSKPRTISSLSS
jgi:hypothetical protein